VLAILETSLFEDHTRCPIERLVSRGAIGGAANGGDGVTILLAVEVDIIVALSMRCFISIAQKSYEVQITHDAASLRCIAKKVYSAAMKRDIRDWRG
jgi:hypothetical protein